MAAMEGLENLHHRLAAGRNPAARRHGRHVRHFVAQRLEQPAHAIVALGRADQHRHHQAFRQFALEIAEHFLARRLDIAQQFLHQMLVIVGQLFQHLEAGFLFAAHHRRCRPLRWRHGGDRKRRAPAPDRQSRWRRRSPRSESGAAAAAFRSPPAARRAARAASPCALSILLTKSKCGIFASASRFR